MVDLVNDAPRTRRAVLTAAAAAGAAAVVNAVAKPLPTLAAAPHDGVAVYTGGQYTDLTVTTLLQNQTTTGTVLQVQSTVGGTALYASSAFGAAVRAVSTSGSGVLAESGDGYGVAASSVDAIGVFAGSQHESALYAENFATAYAAVVGAARSGSTGVQAHAGPVGTSPMARAHTGVMGTAVGTGTGGYFASPAGNALRVQGRASFTRAGRVNIPKNRAYVDITVPGGLASTASIVATLQIPRGTCAVTSVRINYPSAGKARIYLSKVASTTATTPVGFFVIG